MAALRGRSPSWSAPPARPGRSPARHITTTLVSPGSFTVTLSITLLAGAVLGGLGSLAGAVWGSLIIVLVPTYVTDVATSHGLSSSVAANIPVAAYGVVLIVVILLFPGGIQGRGPPPAGPRPSPRAKAGKAARSVPHMPSPP